MILLSIILLSLSAVYFIRLLSRKNMRMAAVSATILYVYLVAWIYAIFIIDIADLGFTDTETQLTLLHGSSIYHSFVQITARMSFIPLSLLQVIVGVAALILTFALAVALHGVFEISRVIIRFYKKTKVEAYKIFENAVRSLKTQIKTYQLIRMYCRANC